MPGPNELKNRQNELLKNLPEEALIKFQEMVSKPNSSKIFGEPDKNIEATKFIEPLIFDAMSSPIDIINRRSEIFSNLSLEELEEFQKIFTKSKISSSKIFGEPGKNIVATKFNDKLLNSESEFNKSFLNYINQLDPEHEQYNYWFNKIRNIDNLPKIELKVGSIYELIFKGRVVPKEMELVRIENLKENKIPDIYFKDFGALRSTKISFLKIYKKV